MDQHYGTSAHRAAISMQSQNHQVSQQHYPTQGQYQQLYSDYAESCYPSPAFQDAGFPGDQYGFHSTSSVPYGSGIESYLDPKYAANPAAFASRLPYLQFHAAAAVAAYGMYDYSFEPAFIRKRNERERQRVKYVNEGYARLREHLPEEYAEKRLSKVETLRGAIMYIKQLQTLLGFDPEKRESKLKRERVPKTTSPRRGEKSAAENDCNMTTITDESDNESTREPNTDGKDDKANFDPHSDGDVKMESSSDASPVKDTRNDPCRNIEQGCLVSPNAETGHSTNTEAQQGALQSTDCPPRNAKFFPENNSVLSPFDCRLEDERRISTAERNSCSQSGSNVPTLSSHSDSFTGGHVCWSHVGTRFNPSLDFADEYFSNDNANKSSSEARINLCSDFDSHGRTIRNYHPYRKTDFAKLSSDSWEDVIPIKAETHTPPPYHRQDFQGQSEIFNPSIHRRNFAGLSQSAFRMNPTSRGGQSDGFKTDTSPESLSGLSP